MTEALNARTEADRRELYSRFKEPLDFYLERLRQWNRVVNLVSRQADARLLEELLLPSLACADTGMLPVGSQGVDLGSGGGFPGIVLAIVRPDLQLQLTDSIQKKCSFLKQVSQELRLSQVSVICGRVAELQTEAQDFITARHFGDTELLFQIGKQLLADSGRLLLFKPDSEVTEFQRLGLIPVDQIGVGPERSLFALSIPCVDDLS